MVITTLFRRARSMVTAVTYPKTIFAKQITYPMFLTFGRTHVVRVKVWWF